MNKVVCKCGHDLHNHVDVCLIESCDCCVNCDQLYEGEIERLTDENTIMRNCNTTLEADRKHLIAEVKADRVVLEYLYAKIDEIWRYIPKP